MAGIDTTDAMDLGLIVLGVMAVATFILVGAAVVLDRNDRTGRWP